MSLDLAFCAWTCQVCLKTTLTWTVSLEILSCRLIAFLGASWSTGTSLGAESHWPYTPCVCAHRSENTHYWNCILSSYHSAVHLLFSLVLLQLSPTFVSDMSFLDFFKTTRNKLSLLPVFVAFRVEMNTWIAEPWSTGDTKVNGAWPSPGFYGWKWEVLDSIQLSVPCVFFYPCCWGTIM